MMWLLFWACTASETVDTAADSGTLDTGDGLDLIAPEGLPQAKMPCREPELSTLESVVDGDTAWFTTSRGSELVRFIGIDTPEKGYDGEPSECFAQEAHDRAIDLLSGGRAWLTFDEECADHYDRTLSYVHVGLGEQYFVQRAMLQGGFATAFSVSPNTTFESDFSEDEYLANAGGVGLWGACAN